MPAMASKIQVSTCHSTASVVRALWYQETQDIDTNVAGDGCGTFSRLHGQAVDLVAIHPFWAAHAVRQLEAEVADQLRYAGIVQDPRQRPPQALPRACKQTCSTLLLAAMTSTQSLTASSDASLILALWAAPRCLLLAAQGR